MALGIKAGSAWIGVQPNFSGFNDSIKRGAAEGGKIGGRALGSAFGDEAAATAKVSTRKLSADLGKARSAEAAAAGRVRVAEERLNEVRNNSKAKASQVAAAEENLANAQRGLTSAQDRTAAATDALSAAQKHNAAAAVDVEKKQSRFASGLRAVRGKVGSFITSLKDAALHYGKLGLAGAGAAAAGLGTAALVKGFGRLKSIDEAEGKLRGLGHSAKATQGILDNALAAVKGTAFGMDEAASTAAGAVAAGVKPGKDLEGVLTLVGDAATIAGTDMESMGSIFNKVASSNKIQGDVIAQLSDQGIPIVQFLSKELGVSAEQVTKLASEGKINFKQFQSAMQTGLGGAAQESGKTFTGAMKNAGAALGRLGASALSGVFPQLKTGLGGATAALDAMGPAAEKAGQKFGTFVAAGFKEAGHSVTAFVNAWKYNDGEVTSSGLPGVMERIGYWAHQAFDGARHSITAFVNAWKYNDGEVTSSGLPGFMERVGYVARQAFDGIGKAWGMLRPHLAQFASSLIGLLPKLVDLGKSVGSFLVDGFKAAAPYLKIAAALLAGAFVGALKIIPPILSAVISTLTGTFNVIRPLLPTIAAIAAAWGAWTLATKTWMAIQAAARGVMIAIRGLQAGYAAATYGAAGATYAQTTAEKIGLVVGRAKLVLTKAITIATKAWAVAQRVLNAVLVNNPIGRVVMLLTLLGAGLVLAYKRSATFRRIVNGAWAGIKTAASATVAWFRGTAWPALRGVFSAVAGAARSLWRNGIQPAFRGIAAVVSWWYNNIVKRYFALVRAAFRAVGSVAKWLWRNAIQPAFRGIVKIAVWLYQRVRWSFIRARELFLALGRIAKWLWRNGVQPAFRGIAKLASWLWNKGIKPAFNRVRGGFRAVAAVAKWLWDKGIKPYFRRVAANAKWLWGKVKYQFDRMRAGFRIVGHAVKTVLWERGVKPAFSWIAKRAKWLWGKVKENFDKLRAGLRKVRSAFTTARDKIGDAWGGILNRIKKPIGRALRWLKDNFVDKLRGWLKGIPGIGKLNKIMPKISVPKGFDRGGWTGPGDRLDPAGIVHADEFVVQKKSRRVFERENPGVLDHINKTGKLPSGLAIPGYRIGGKVAGLNKRFLQQLHEFNKAARGRYSVYSGYRSSAHQRILYNRYLSGNGPVAAKPGSSMHNKGLAADLAPSDARNRHGNKFAARFGLRYTVPSESWHIEPDWGRGAKSVISGLSSGGGLFDLPDWAKPGWILGKVKNVMKGFDTSKYGIVGKTIPPMATAVRKAAGKLISKAADKLDFSGGPGMDFSGITAKTNVALGQAMAKRYGWTGRNWTSLRALWNGESNWNHKAKNPSSGAYGIPQCVDLDTLILTERGWLRHDEVRVGDRTPAYDPETGTSVWSMITEVLHPGKAELFTFGVKRWSARSTGNHRWLVDRMASDKPVAREMVELQHVQGRRHRVVTSVPFTSDQKLDISDDEALMLGWIAGDGWEQQGTLYGLTVAGKRDEVFAEMLAGAAARGEVRETRTRDGITEWRLPTGYARDLMARAGHPKRDPEALVLAMSDTQREAWLRGLMACDAYFGQATPQLCQKRGPISEAALLALYMSGKRPSVYEGHGEQHEGILTIDVTKPEIGMRLATVEADGVEEVWCVRTEHGSWTARQGDDIFVTGNSLPGSKMATVGKDWRTNAKTQIAWGLKYIKERYGNPANAYSKWKGRSPHWYADGGRVIKPTGYARGVQRATPGPHWVGEDGPELAWFRGGERVMSNRRSQEYLRASQDGLSGPMTFNLYDSDGMLMETVYGAIDSRDRQQAVRDRLRR